MTRWIRPGARCVCISDRWPWVLRQGSHELPTRVPMLNEVLTIRAVRDRRSHPGLVYLSFWEIESWQASGPISGWFWFLADNFRPLQEAQTDISALTALLDAAPVRADEGVSS